MKEQPLVLFLGIYVDQGILLLNLIDSHIV